MTDFFYQIVKDACNYNHREEIIRLFAIKFIDLKDWVEECLDNAEVPNGYFRECFIREMFAHNSEEPHNLFRYIQDMCRDEVDSICWACNCDMDEDEKDWWDSKMRRYCDNCKEEADNYEEGKEVVVNNGSS